MSSTPDTSAATTMTVDGPVAVGKNKDKKFASFVISVDRPRIGVPLILEIVRPGRTRVEVYTRHNAGCPHEDDRKWRDCDCPKWLTILAAKKKRHTSGEIRWSKAEKIANEIEELFNPVFRKAHQIIQQNAETTSKQILIETALGLWWEEHAKKKRPTVHKSIFNELGDFAKERGFHFVHQLTSVEFTAYRATWKGKMRSGLAKKQMVLGNLGRFFVRMGWHKESQASTYGPKNPDGKLSPAQGTERVPRPPFSVDQVDQIAEIALRLPVIQRKNARECPKLWWIFTLLLRWSGLAPIDAWKLRRDQLRDDDTILVTRQKSGKEVEVLLPADVAQWLREFLSPFAAPEFFFFDGVSADGGIALSWWRAYRRIFAEFKPALVLFDFKNKPWQPSAYSFRTTFAVEFLRVKGKQSIYDLAELLGNSVGICEKYYLPYLKKTGAVIERQRETFAAQGAPGYKRKASGAVVVPIRRSQKA